jgi:phospholipid/cholesterol/gamma-HCH transport system ATP-binding protein
MLVAERDRSPPLMAAPHLSTSSDPHVEVRGVHKSFDGKSVLSAIDITFPRGEISVIIGGSGTGKTTLLRLLIGLEKPDQGSILISGQDIVPLGDVEMNQVRRKFGMVFQYAALLDSMTVLENVAFPLREHTSLGEQEIREQVRAKLADLGLNDVGQLFPSQLSGGMRKRVGLARALMLDPELVVYDEPTSGLDPFTTELVDEMIVSTRARLGLTSIVISHDMASALRIADRIHLLAEGRVAGSGTPDELVGGKVPLALRFMQASSVDFATARAWRKEEGPRGRGA